MINARFIWLTAGALVWLFPAWLFAASPASPTNPIPALSAAYSISSGGQSRHFELAVDELGLRQKGNRQVRKIAAVSAGDVAKAVQAERDKQSESEVELVLYEKGRDRSESSRAFVTRRILARLKPGSNARELARRIGVRLAAAPEYAPDYVILEAATSEGALMAMAQLRAQAEVLSADVLLARRKAKKGIVTDPLFPGQWHLQNRAQFGGALWIDANVTSAWATATGKGVTIGIIDDGLEYTHPDLAPNYNASLAYDFVDLDNDPKPDLAMDDHGTCCAGIAAARGNNALGVCGAAFEATLTAYRLISQDWTDEQEAEAFLLHNDVVEIKSNSWGITDDGNTVEGPGPLAAAALANGVTAGRQGRGTIFVFAGGNGLDVQDNSNNDGYANSIYTIAVGAVNDFGFESYYSEPGANLLVCAPSDGGEHNQGITTTDLTGANGYNMDSTDDLADLDYTRTFGGTSAAAPLVAGVVALMLETNPQLGWRDVQEILIRAARRVHCCDPDWSVNSAGLAFNHKYGAGLVDATTAVALAQGWVNLGSYASNTLSQDNLGLAIPDNTSSGVSRSFSFDMPGFRVERVTVTVDITHPSRGDLAVTLTSPSGMVSRLAEQHSDSSEGYSNWTFSTVRHWGESATGVWTLRVADRVAQDVGQLNAAAITLYGSTNAGPILAGVDGVLVAEGNVPANQAVDPGETVTCQLRLKQLEGLSVTNLVATLLPLAGVSGPSAAQSYGSLTANGIPVERSFTFTAMGGCGTFIDPILRLTDGASFLGYAHFSIPLGATNQKTFSGSSLAIRDNTTATPYPSTSLVSGVQGRVQNLSVKINGFSHGYPDDVGLLLVSPAKIEQVLMDGATDLPLSKCNLVFDGNAPVYLPFVGSTPSGNYKPYDYYGFVFAGDPGFENAYTLGEFNGLPSSGLWKLFAEDFDVGDSGSITSWQLVFTAADCTDNVFLTQTNLTFPKEAGTALLNITRTGGREGDASVHFLTVPDSATENADFVPTNGILSFGPGELGKTIAVSLLHHATPHTNRTFFVRLLEAAGNTQLGNATQCVVTIQEGDRDGDGLPDDYEIASGFLNPDFAGDAGLDFDRDGSSNFAEFVAGTNPQSATSVLRLKVSQTASIMRVQIPTQTGRTYDVETSPDLKEWSLWKTGITGTGGTVELLETSPQSQVQRGYRVKVTLTNP